MKLKKHHKLVIAADGSPASGKTTGAKKISKKYDYIFTDKSLDNFFYLRLSSFCIINSNFITYFSISCVVSIPSNNS